MPKAREVYKALIKGGWVQDPHKKGGSHRKLKKNGKTRIWAYHDGLEIGQTQLKGVCTGTW